MLSDFVSANLILSLLVDRLHLLWILNARFACSYVDYVLNANSMETSVSLDPKYIYAQDNLEIRGKHRPVSISNGTHHFTVRYTGQFCILRDRWQLLIIRGGVKHVTIKMRFHGAAGVSPTSRPL